MTTKTALSPRMAQTLTSVALEALSPHDDLLIPEESVEVLGVEIKPMADGSGNWAVFSAIVDEDNSQHDFRTIVNRDGQIVANEELN